MIYSPNSDSEIAAVIPAFEEATGIKVILQSMGTGDVLARLEAEKANPQADVNWGAVNLGFWTDHQDLYEYYISPNDKNLPEAYQSYNGYFTYTKLSGSAALLINEDVFAELGLSEDYDFISLGDYASMVGVDMNNLSADRVAVLYAQGQIVDGEGYGEEIYGNTLAAKIAELRDDERVKAVVVRVNSPGGSALASDVIWREMELLREVKPVIVSMGSYAASGGYYISCPADVIVADRLTLTGSIGVFGMILDPREALKNKLGITFDGVRSNTSSDFLTTGPLTPLQRGMIMRGVDQVYGTFTEHVSEGRNLPLERVLEIAGGRVWSGNQAICVGLIDTYGCLKMDSAIAVDMECLCENFRVVVVYDQP